MLGLQIPNKDIPTTMTRKAFKAFMVSKGFTGDILRLYLYNYDLLVNNGLILFKRENKVSKTVDEVVEKTTIVADRKITSSTCVQSIHIVSVDDIYVYDPYTKKIAEFLRIIPLRTLEKNLRIANPEIFKKLEISQ
jgi:hypothetical protein